MPSGNPSSSSSAVFGSCVCVCRWRHEVRRGERERRLGLGGRRTESLSLLCHCFICTRLRRNARNTDRASSNYSVNTKCTHLSRSVDVPDGEDITPRGRLCPDRPHHCLPALVARAYKHAFEHRDYVLGGHHVPISSAPSPRGSWLDWRVLVLFGGKRQRQETGKR